MTKGNYIKTGFKGYVWLLMAVFCIVFSSASKKVIELKTNPAENSVTAFAKKIKDGSRDKRQYLTATVVHADSQPLPDDVLGFSFLLPALISFALLYLFDRNSPVIRLNRQDLAFMGFSPLYLQHHRLQV